jgi:hypothetical protein
MINAGNPWMRESYLFRIIWGKLYEQCYYKEDFSFELLITKVFEITRYTCINFPSLGRKFKLKFELSQNFEL